MSLASRILHTVASLAEVGVGVGKGVADIASGTIRGTRELAGEAMSTLPRLARLGQIHSRTRISFGSVLAEQGRTASRGECFIFDDRVLPTLPSTCASTTWCAG